MKGRYASPTSDRIAMPAFTRRSPARKLIIAICTLALVIFFFQPFETGINHNFSSGLEDVFNRELVEDVLYETISFSGFSNNRVPDGPACENITIHDQQLQISPSLYLEDDIIEIAETIIHPMIDYTGQSKDLSFRQTVAKTWGQMAGSSVWLPQFQVYFSVTRVFFYTQGVKHWPKISFIYAQVYDAHWNALKDFDIPWQGENITFPRILDIHVPHEVGSGFFGPEDPRIILEHSVSDAEPVIVFNMIENAKTLIRSMHIHRPFSNYTTTLKIEGQKPGDVEKNWSPFFLPHQPSPGQKAWPSKYIHFIYDWNPLKILRCHVMNGMCAFVYKQDSLSAEWDSYKKTHEYGDTKGVMRGGTNFEPLPISPGPGLTSFVGFPRTHTDGGCFNEAIYRPVMMTLTTNGTHFYLDYASEALDFGHAILTQTQYNDVCDAGRILLTNSIVDFQSAAEHDILTMSFTVADSTVQIANIRGVRNLIERLPQFQSNITDISHPMSMSSRLNVTHDVLACSIQSATDYAIANTNVTDRSIPRLATTPKPAANTLPAAMPKQADMIEDILKNLESADS